MKNKKFLISTLKRKRLSCNRNTNLDNFVIIFLSNELNLFFFQIQLSKNDLLIF